MVRFICMLLSLMRGLYNCTLYERLGFMRVKEIKGKRMMTM